MMSFARIPKWILRSDAFEEMKGADLKVLLVLADCLDAKSDSGRVSVRAIMDRTGMARRTVQKGIERLVAIGIIERDQADGRYEFLPEAGGALECAGAHSDAHHAHPDAHAAHSDARVAHSSAHPEGRNKEEPRTSYQEPLHQEVTTNGEAQIPAEGGSGQVNAIMAAADLLESCGWKRHQFRDHRAIAKLLIGIHAGTHLPVTGDEARIDPIGWLRPRVVAWVQARTAERDAGRGDYLGWARNWVAKEHWTDDPEAVKPYISDASHYEGGSGATTQFEADDPAYAISGLGGGNA